MMETGSRFTHISEKGSRKTKIDHNVHQRLKSLHVKVQVTWLSSVFTLTTEHCC